MRRALDIIRLFRAGLSPEMRGNAGRRGGSRRDRRKPGPPAQPASRPVTLPPFLPGIADSATAVGPRSAQQDACYHVFLPGCKIVAVADGIGQHPKYSHYHSTHVMLSALGFLQRGIMSGVAMSDELIRMAFQDAQNHCRLLNETIRREDPDGYGGTTMIIACETAGYFHVGMCGDGNAIYRLADAKIPNYVVEDQRRTHHLGQDHDTIKVNTACWSKVDLVGGILVIATDGIAIDGNTARGVTHAIDEVSSFVARSNPDKGLDVHRLLETIVTSGAPVNEYDNRSIGVLVDQHAIDFLRNGHGRTP